ncbi:MAG: DMT family transporter [Pseudomonadota bacterium]
MDQPAAVPAAAGRQQNARLGILFVLIAVAAISVNDMMIKFLSGDYPLHQIVFMRSAIGISISLAILQFEGGLRALATDRPVAHLGRGLSIVVANMLFFAALPIMPLADATALFFVAPLFITILSLPLLGERVGRHRLSAVMVGFLGVLVMLGPGASTDTSVAVLALPVGAAFFYALMQVMTRRLGVAATASAMAVYVQGTFILISVIFFAIAGDGRFADGVESASVRFLLRAWIWPEAGDIPLIFVLGLASGVIGYGLSQAYRVAQPATVAPFEYTLMPLSIVWGVIVFGDLPGPGTLVGIALIIGAGLYVWLRERSRGRPIGHNRPIRRG